MWMSWRATLPKGRLHYVKLKNVWQWLLLKSKGFYGYHESLQSNGGLKQSPP
jgi:hypothetical protein